MQNYGFSPLFHYEIAKKMAEKLFDINNVEGSDAFSQNFMLQTSIRTVVVSLLCKAEIAIRRLRMTLEVIR